MIEEILTPQEKSDGTTVIKLFMGRKKFDYLNPSENWNDMMMVIKKMNLCMKYENFKHELTKTHWCYFYAGEIYVSSIGEEISKRRTKIEREMEERLKFLS